MDAATTTRRSPHVKEPWYSVLELTVDDSAPAQARAWVDDCLRRADVEIA